MIVAIETGTEATGVPVGSHATFNETCAATPSVWPPRAAGCGCGGALRTLGQPAVTPAPGSGTLSAPPGLPSLRPEPARAASSALAAWVRRGGGRGGGGGGGARGRCAAPGASLSASVARALLTRRGGI